MLGEVWNHYLVHLTDILLVSFLIYHLLLLIQGTRAVQIAMGIGVVAVVTVLAQFAGLPSLSWLLQKFWFAGVIVIAVVFQPELRSALARLGGRTSAHFSIHQEMYVVNEIVAAVKEAARRQMGMLLAIEREVGLRDYVESGTPVNAEVTRELLLAIFQPPGALHDGAVIIQGNRMAGAGCILPISQDQSLSRFLGTRHRAAVGITEVSDAWAVCVSEETGNVSFAHDGKLQSVDPDELRQHLLNVFRSSPQKPADAAVA